MSRIARVFAHPAIANPATFLLAIGALDYALFPEVRPVARMLILGTVAAPLHWAGFPGAADYLISFI